jgi:taurine dioxygenase
MIHFDMNSLPKIAPIDPKHLKLLEQFGAKMVPLEPLGIAIYGIDLSAKTPMPQNIVQALEFEMANRGFIVFKNQQDLSVDDFLNASCLWGGKELHSTHGVHPQTPNNNPHIFRVSNDPRHGILGVGPQWHNDGSFNTGTFSHSGYHIIEPAHNGGGTYFAHQAAAYDFT